MNDAPGPRELVALLAEPDRLRALAAVTLGAATLPDVAERAGLEPRVAARALSRLVAGGLLEGDAANGYQVRADAFKAAARRAATGPDALAGDDRSRTSSTRLFQAPQAGQRPTQRGLAAPHSVQA